MGNTKTNRGPRAWKLAVVALLLGALGIASGLIAQHVVVKQIAIGVGVLFLISGFTAAWLLNYRAGLSKSREERKIAADLVNQQRQSNFQLAQLADQIAANGKKATEDLGQLKEAIQRTTATNHDQTKSISSSSGRSGESSSETGQEKPNQFKRLDAGGNVKKIARPTLGVVETRNRRPITGWTAEQWGASRRGEKSFEVEEIVPAQRTAMLPFASDIPVAMIADDFTFNSFRDEFKTYRLHPSNWRQTFEKNKPQLFLCESAWEGGEPRKAPWRGKIYSSSRFSHENRTELISIIEYCRAEGIPTVFWNKEDPAHYGDRVNDFVRTAFLFDYIFTTAEECVSDYEKDLKRGQVDVLPFAVQPRIFNPLGRDRVRNRVNFAGTWYHLYEARSRAAEAIMDLVLETDNQLVIYDRMYELKSPSYEYPDKYKPYIRPSIPFTETPKVYKEAKFGITLNTVTQSSTMFARRVFELAASGAVVLSNYSRGVDNFFGESVIFADRDPDRFRNLSSTEYDQLQSDALEISLQNTYSHRAETILQAVGIDFISRNEMPSAFGEVFSREQVQKLVSEAERSGLNGGILAIGDGADPGLQMTTMRESVPGWTILSTRELRRADYRTRSLLGTRGVIVANQNLEFPTKREIEYLGAHEAYVGLPTKRLKHGSPRYAELETTLEHAYVPSGMFRETMKKPVGKIFSV